nr:hypothetical protein [Tanacetum cinerariifolium]
MQSVAPPSPDYIPGPEEPQTPPVLQDEDEREPMFIQPHDPEYMPEPMYPEYIPLEDEHVLPAKEQPLLHVVAPTSKSTRYVTESDLEEDTKEYEYDESEDGPVDYPMDEGDDGDDGDGDSSRDDADDEDEDEEEGEEHLASVASAVVIPTDYCPGSGFHTLPPEADIKRLLAMPTPPPSPLTSLSPPSLGEHLARCTTLPAHSPPPVPSPLLPSSGCPTQIQTIRMASTQALIDAVTAALPSPPLPPLPPPIYIYIPPPVDSRDDIPETEMPPRKRDTWVDPAEEVPEIAPMTLGEVNTRDTELSKLHEHDTQDLYVLLEDAQDNRTRISQRVTMDLQQASITDGKDSSSDGRHETRMGDMHAELLALREQPRRARQPGSDPRVPDHQDAPRDADSHI